VVTDGYQVYHKLAKERRNLKVAGCWVHARRPFAEFIKSVGQDTAKGSIAQEAYSMITEIMHIDNTLPWSSRVQKECPNKHKKS
jgi:transposase